MRYKSFCVAIMVATVALAGCGNAGDTPPAAAEVKPADPADKYGNDLAQSPGKPSAPISFRYKVQGTPIVGQPVAVDVFVSSSVIARRVNVQYRVNDASSMSFPEAQAQKTEMSLEADGEPQMQQITVIPQREGRLYINVSAEVETPEGSMIKTQAIPIQVGAAPLELDENGELIKTAEGETVVSMPAE